MMKIRNVLLVLVLIAGAGEVMGQISLIGGANVNVFDAQRMNKIGYFVGMEFKISLSERLKLNLAPQYSGLADGDSRIESVMLPVGVAFQFNELWDEKTPLVRLIDINLGGYGSYIFEVRTNEQDVTNDYSFLDYGAQLSLKMRLFVFYPLYISYNHSLAFLYRFDNKESFDLSTLQVGVYIPVSHFFKYY